MNKALEEAVEYFKSNKGFKRMMEKMKNKYISFDRQTPGNITIDNPSKEEKDALSGFMKKNYGKNKSITINIKKFQQRLDETRFEGTVVKELLEKYFGEEIVAHKKAKQNKIDEFNEYLEKLLSQYAETRASSILEKIINERGENYITIKSKYESEKQNLENAIHQVCNCVNNLPQEKIRLPIFATLKLNNPHGLDRKNIAGKLFIMFLQELEEITNKQKYKIKNAEDLAELYYKYNLLIDDVSNMVLCKNIIGCTGSKEHEGWAGFFKNNEAMQVTLDNLAKIDNVKLQYDYCIVVENPAVFMQIAEKIGDKKIPLVCTYGQLKLSGIELIKLLTNQCTKIYYSGDTDPEGIQIADKIKSKFPDKIQLLGFDVDTYYKTISEVKLTQQRLKKLENIQNKELQEIAKVVSIEKKAAYEEMKIMMLF